MKRYCTSLLATAWVVAAPFAGAFSTGVPDGGLPSAATYSQSILPDLDGVVSWKTLSEVQPVKKEGKLAMEFSRGILALDGKAVRLQGFMLPMEAGDAQKHFLISAVPPQCPFCMPASPDAVVEVFARTAIAYSYEPVLVSGRMVVLKSDPSGMLYRLTDAEPIRTQFK